ncbi:putative LSG1-large-subunit GTPase [Exidia glandulosa HHB12029]|uniref:Putative LSG1-large-subunit GTPase n=1 Tax=Exidia glandulosa HHB12029 TaxID=1314781 RepID=A0A165IRR2_EXIGL|nr:putative LSG1-large-subunit GTPase [Exidia glandulosa HHB12029]
MPPPKDKNKVGLGRAIINKRIKDAHRPRDSQLYTTDSGQGLQSVTQERDLDEFLNTAQLAGTDFTAEKENITIIQAPGVRSAVYNPFLLSADDEKAALRRQEQHKSALRVPRRPPWTKSMTAPQLDRQERDAFLGWRRSLAQVQEREDLVFTPFERNIEVWRQLWRVIERSHLVVQIVDARNPLRFRCEDLEAYVKDIEGSEGEKGTGPGKRNSLLLINKSDLLNVQQRKQWADYFDSQNIKYAFYSAANANAVREARQLAAQRQQEQQEERAKEPQDDVAGVEDGVKDVSAGLNALKVAGPATPKAAEDDEVASEDGESGEDDEDESSEAEDEDEDDSGSETGHYYSVDEGEEEEAVDPRIRVLSVLELEALFLKVAPPLEVFADSKGVNPPKTVVGLVGYPNVGKSSTINSLVGEKKVSVSSTPGKTKHFQTIHLSDGMVLCDCPGLVFPQFATTKADLVCDGVLPIDQLREHTGPATLVTRRVPRDILEATYGLTLRVHAPEENVSDDVTAEDLLVAYAIARGFARAGQGNPDESRAARYVLKDYVNAKLLYCHPPPGVDPDEFNTKSRNATLARLQASSRKRAPVTRVGKGADTFIPTDPTTAHQQPPQSRKARAIDHDFFNSTPGLSARPFVQSGSIRSGQEFSRSRLYPHQNSVADDGTPVNARSARVASVLQQAGGHPAERTKKHNKGNKRQKQRSGKGYD